VNIIYSFVNIVELRLCMMYVLHFSSTISKPFQAEMQLQVLSNLFKINICGQLVCCLRWWTVLDVDINQRQRPPVIFIKQIYLH